MTIDKAIKQLETYTIPCGKYKVAYDLAVETMRKYQRTEQILDDCDLEAWEILEKVKEVVEE